MKERTAYSTTYLLRLLKVINVSECDELPVCAANCELDGKRDEDDDDGDFFTRSITTKTSALLRSRPTYIMGLNSSVSFTFVSVLLQYTSAHAS